MAAHSPRLRRRALALVLAAAAVAPGVGAAVASPIAFDRPDLQAAATLRVSVPSVVEGGTWPTSYTADGRNLSPPVSWSEGPPQTRSYVVLMQDADLPAAATGPDASVHWLVYAVPAATLTLPRGMRNVASPSSPLGAAQGRNSHDSVGYTGPRLAVGEPLRHYALQVFALDRAVRVRPGAELPAVLRAMAGHVVARGELTASYVAPSPDATHGRQKGSTAPAEPGP